jgi:predicted heme/steroid binding protein
VDDKPVTAQKHVDNFLSQFVYVALDGAQQDASRNLALYDGLEQSHHFTKDLTSHDEPGQKVLVALVAQAHLAHAFPTILEDPERIVAGVQSLTDKGQSSLFLQVGDGGDQDCVGVCASVPRP